MAEISEVSSDLVCYICESPFITSSYSFILYKCKMCNEKTAYCLNCRKNYLNAVKEFFVGIKDKLCETCKNRLNINPMRIFDCKNSKKFQNFWHQFRHLWCIFDIIYRNSCNICYQCL